MTLIGYGIFYNEGDGDLLRTGGYSGTSKSSKIYRHIGTARVVARKRGNCHVRGLYVKDFDDIVKDPTDTGVIFVSG